MKSGSATGSADAAAGVEASLMKRKWEITGGSGGGSPGPSSGAKKLAQLGTEPTHKREASNRFVKEIHSLEIASLRAYLDGCNDPFDTSAVYEVATSERVVDESLRQSKFRALKDPALFKLAAEIVDRMSDQDPLNDFTLVPNDVSHIVYNKGGFFRAHSDYLSLTSNVIDEYTMLLCVTPPSGLPTGGGCTRITTAPGQVIDSLASITPGSAVIFRKDLRHEGLVVEDGSKEIVSLNLWCSRKADATILLITFPPPKKTTPKPGPATGVAVTRSQTLLSSLESSASPLSATAGSQSYAVSASIVASFPTCILNGKLSFESAVGEDSSKVVTYECSDCDYETFGVVFKVLMGIVLTSDQLVANSELLDFFGFAADEILVQITNADNAAGSNDNSHGTQKSIESHVDLDGSKQVQNESGSSVASSGGGGISHPAEELSDADIIICTTEDRALVVADVAKQLSLPYIKFSVIFVEGRVSSDGDTEALIMQPVWASLGDYNNILGLRGLIHRGDQEKVPLHEHRSLEFENPLSKKHTDAISLPGKIVSFDSDDNGVKLNADASATVQNKSFWDESRFWFGLRLAPTIPSSKKKNCVPDANFTTHNAMEIVMGNDSGFHVSKIPNMVVLPGGDDINDSSPSEGYFHLDSKGNSCFSLDEAAKASDLLIETAFFEHLQTKINLTAFVLPQSSADGEAFFCNELVYGKFNLIKMCGVVRLDEMAAARGAAGKADLTRTVAAEQDASALASAKEKASEGLTYGSDDDDDDDDDDDLDSELDFDSELDDDDDDDSINQICEYCDCRDCDCDDFSGNEDY